VQYFSRNSLPLFAALSQLSLTPYLAQSAENVQRQRP
jgi:hypothetical protein